MLPLRVKSLSLQGKLDKPSTRFQPQGHKEPLHKHITYVWPHQIGPPGPPRGGRGDAS